VSNSPTEGRAVGHNFLKGTHPRTIPAKFGLIWFYGFKGNDLNVIFYQNIPNLHNQYKSAERKISQKSPEYMLNQGWSLGGSLSKNCVRQPCPPFKMAAVTKNRNFFNYPLLL
jgi:hypothetical protein